jgi:hypothetical protein
VDVGMVRRHRKDFAARHAEAALRHVASGDYMGEHWLATLAACLLSVPPLD